MSGPRFELGTVTQELPSRPESNYFIVALGKASIKEDILEGECNPENGKVL